MFETAKQSCNLRDEGQRVAYSNESPPIIEPHTDHFERAHLGSWCVRGGPGCSPIGIVVAGFPQIVDECELVSTQLSMEDMIGHSS